MADTTAEYKQKCPMCGHIISASHEDLLILGVKYHDLMEHDFD